MTQENFEENYVPRLIADSMTLLRDKFAQRVRNAYHVHKNEIRF